MLKNQSNLLDKRCFPPVEEERLRARSRTRAARTRTHTQTHGNKQETDGENDRGAVKSDRRGWTGGGRKGEERKDVEKQTTANKQKVAAFISQNKGSAGHFPQLRMTSASEDSGRAEHCA